MGAARVRTTDYPLSKPRRRRATVAVRPRRRAASSTLETLASERPEMTSPQQIVTTLRQVRELAPDTRTAPGRRRSYRRAFAGQSVTLALMCREKATTCTACRCRWPAAPATTATCTSSSAAARRRLRARSSPAPCARRDAIDRNGAWAGDFWAIRRAAAGLAACDLSFAPVKSLIEHALARDRPPSLSLFLAGWRRGPHRPLHAWPTSAARGRRAGCFEHQLAYHNDQPPGARQI